jgi:hypothetical protein
VQVFFGYVQIDRCSFEVFMAHQNLERSQVGACFQVMSGEAVPQGLLILLMICT